MKTIYKLCVLFLAVTFAFCHKDKIEDPPPFDGVKIVDGWIVSPEWLAEVVEKVGERYNVSPETGLPPYPSVYGIKHKGEDYICVSDWLASNLVRGRMFFTLSGEQVNQGSAPFTGDGSLHDELAYAENKILLWDSSHIRNQTRSSISTYASMQIINTPHDSPVDVLVGYEEYNTPAEILYQLALLQSTYPNAEVLSDPTTTYNCHGYAWHMSEGGSPVSIGTMPKIYIEDGSYIPTSSTTPNAKVMYRYADHSAIVETPDIFVSKWGGWPLMRHNKNYGPYNSSGLTYWKRNTPLVIAGRDNPLLNTNVEFNVPAAQNITFNRWEITPGSYTMTTLPNNPNLKIKFTAQTTYTLKAIFNLPNGSTYMATKTVTPISTAPPPPTPGITMSGELLSYQQASALGRGSETVYWVHSDIRILTVQVSATTYSPYATYSWRCSYMPPYSGTGRYINITLPSYTMLFPVECRASTANYTTSWSTVWVYSSSASPMSNPARFLQAVEEAETKYGVKLDQLKTDKFEMLKQSLN